MNKHEAIKKVEQMGEHERFVNESIPKLSVLNILNQLDEPQKPVIPQFVADWIEVCKENLTNSLYLAMTPSFLKANNQGVELTIWIKKNEETFARAWLDGYTVEKEKRYKVVMPNISSTGGVLTRIKHDDSWIWIDTLGTIIEGQTHTRTELEEAGFGWVFDCPGVEVEEVEE